MNQYFDSQFKEMSLEYPRLEVTEDTDKFIIMGELEFKANVIEEILFDKYRVKINVEKDYPKTIPIVFEKSGKIPKKFGHINPDGSLCLGVTPEIKLGLSENQNLRLFIEKYIINYLALCSYYIKFGFIPIGERSHGDDGIREYYKEFFCVSNYNQMLEMLRFRGTYLSIGGHAICPCCNIKLRNCIHQKILTSRITKDMRDYYISDYRKLSEK